ncbi:MAG TPA: hypothetical protein VGH14_10330 [Solirubrobacterales bacterium]|jgi:hypothetical protein
MNLKRFLLALTAVAMLAAVMANSASATMTAEGQWFNGSGVLLPETGVNCSKGEGPLVLTGTVGTTPTKLEATNVECVGAVVKNESSHGVAVGKLNFTGVTVVEPAGCAVAGGHVETEKLKAELYMSSASTTKAYVKFQPFEAGGLFASFEITGSCAAAGPRTVKGSTFGEAANPTKTPATTQGLNFSTAVEEATESTTTLKFAGNNAHLSGKANNTLVGGGSFEAH